MSPSLVSMDAMFGPQLPGHFDFTIMFEHSIFWLIPSVVVILSTPFFLKSAIRSQPQVRAGFHLVTKVVFSAALVGIRAGQIALWHKSEYSRLETTLAASAIAVLASICTMAIIVITHLYSIRPSDFLSLSLSVTMLLGIAMTRSYFLRDGLKTIAVLEACVTAAKVVLIALEEVSKRPLYLSQSLQSSGSTEDASGFWNRAFFMWLNPLLYFGWRKSFTNENLPEIGDEFISEKHFDSFGPHWARATKTSKFSLFFALVRALKWHLLKVFLPRICHVGATIAQPFLILRTLQIVSDGRANSNTSSGIIGAFILVLLISTITKTLFQHWEYRVVTFIRGILIIAIYDKMLHLTPEALESSTAITLMSADVDGTESIVALVYEVTSSILQLGLCIWILWRFVGPACFLVFLPALATFLGSLIVSRAIRKARGATSQQTQHRVSATSNILAQIKSVKSMGLSKSLSSYLQQKRENEINAAMKERYAVLWVFAFAAINWAITPAIIFAGAYFWTRAEHKMTVSEVFAIMAVLSVCSEPLITVFRSFSSWGQGMAAIERVYEFLIQDERKDGRTVSSSPLERTVADAEKLPNPSDSVAVELSDVCVTSATNGPILQSINMRVPWGDLVIMWGPIGCGKSTLLKTILGESEVSSGTVCVGSKTAAYCSQETWLRNCSFEEAIVGQLEFIESRYKAVVKACALDVDLQALPDGDQTQIGTAGCNLSGGQRQRLSLARGAYAQEDIMIVDDALSSVDPETAGIIFDRLFGPGGLVRSWNCTVIMTTNKLELLEFANQVFQLSKEGCLTRQEDNDINTFASQIRNNKDAPIENASESDEKEVEVPQIQEKEASEEPDDGSKAGDVSLYTYFLKPAGIWAVLCWLTFVMMAATAEWMPSIFLRIWYAKAPDDSHYFAGFVMVAVLCVVLNVFSGAFYFIFVFNKITRAAHQELLDATMGATPQFFSKTDSSSILNRFSQDITFITRRLSLLLNQVFFVGCTVIVEAVMIAAGVAYTTPIMIAMLIALYCIQFYYLRSSRQLRRIELESSARLFKQFTETSDGMLHVRSFGWDQGFRRELYGALDRSQKPRYLLYCIQRWLTIGMDLAELIASVSLVAIATKLPEKTSSPAVGLALLSVMSFSGSATIYVEYWTTLETALGAIRRVRQFVMDTPQEDKGTLNWAAEKASEWPTAGQIELKAVTATYETADGKEHKAINDVSVTIQAGEKVGIMGRTGSGKSTLISTLLRMVDYTGNISIDGIDIRTIPQDLLRSRITSISQDGLRLKESLRFNMFPFDGTQPTDNDIISVLESVDLWTHAERNGGLDADYTKMGFSTGQKQLMFLARGILHQSQTKNKIVLIDEVTSSMTIDAEAGLQRLIDASFQGCTILLVSHRVESFDSVNRVLRFRMGKLDAELAGKTIEKTELEHQD
ncbi:hypothetical protein NLG97_g3135 [Lecanicillium saksenae]|uniref:Uncharacterized protein n=1 Tax=Lecanicillium saksenae TaxID=468837 RepID=A0ACC1R2Y9_9HYPO|nr:hypothetical protein NLG97_g3135 [Lecanicillium saksenae]